MLARRNWIGHFDRKLRIMQPVKSTNATTNEQIISGYTLFKSVSGKRRKQPSREIYEGEQQVALRTVIYDCRYIDGVTEEMIVDDGDEKLKIVGIEQIDRKASTVITAQKRDNDAAFFET